MRKIIEILGVEEWVKDNKRHSRTYAILDDGEEVVGYGSDFEVGDLVERFYDPTHDVIKMRKGNHGRE